MLGSVSKDWFSSLFFIFLSIYVCWESVDLGFGSLRKPGPGLFSLMAGLLLGFLGILVFFKSWLSKAFREKACFATIPWRPLLLTFCCLLGFNLFLKTLGFNFTAFLFVGTLLRAVEKKRWTVSVSVGLGVTLGAYVVFDLLLQSQLPEGPFGFFGF